MIIIAKNLCLALYFLVIKKKVYWRLILCWEFGVIARRWIVTSENHQMNSHNRRGKVTIFSNSRHIITSYGPDGHAAAQEGQTTHLVRAAVHGTTYVNKARFTCCISSAVLLCLLNAAKHIVETVFPWIAAVLQYSFCRWNMGKNKCFTCINCEAKKLHHKISAIHSKMLWFF